MQNANNVPAGVGPGEYAEYLENSAVEAIYTKDTEKGNAGYDETNGITTDPTWLLKGLLQGDDLNTYVEGQLDQYMKTGKSNIG